MVAGKPEASAGKQCLQVTATLGENTGGHLFKRIDPIQDRDAPGWLSLGKVP